MRSFWLSVSCCGLHHHLCDVQFEGICKIGQRKACMQDWNLCLFMKIYQNDAYLVQRPLPALRSSSDRRGASVDDRVSARHRDWKAAINHLNTPIFYSAVIERQSIATISKMEGTERYCIPQANCRSFRCSFNLPSCTEFTQLVHRMTNTKYREIRRYRELEFDFTHSLMLSVLFGSAIMSTYLFISYPLQ